MSESTPLGSDENIEDMITYLQQGGSVQDIYEIADRDMEVMFVSATRYLQRHEYQKASDSFLFLTFLNPYVGKYWQGLGEACRYLQDYEKAVEAYILSSMMDWEDPRPYFHCGSCYIALNKPQPAIDRFLLAIEYSRGKPEFGTLTEICYELVDDLSHRIDQGEES